MPVFLSLFRRRCVLFGGLGVLLLGAACARPASESVVDLYVASSLAAPLEAAAGLYREQGGGRVRINSAASSVLARQIEAGAPAHVFVSAHPRWTDYLKERGVVTGARPLVGNRLVLARHRDGPFARPADADGRPWRIALADADHVPLGWYGRQALQHRGTWTSWQAHGVTTENAAHSVRLLVLQEVDFAVLYAGDLHQVPALEAVTVFEEDRHDPIRYQLAVLPNASPEAVAFADFLCEPSMHDLWRRFGLTPVVNAP